MSGRIGSLVVGALMGALVALSPAQAQEKIVPMGRGQMALSFAPLVKQAAPAVVNIYTKRVVRRSAFSGDPFFEQFLGQGLSRQQVQNSLGSGVIVSDDGRVVTNVHVIEDSDEITVVLSDRREFAAKVIQRDPRTDLAILKIDVGTEKLPFLTLGDSDALEVGDLVLAIGNPFGVGQTVTSGIVSALARTQVGVSDFNFFIQTDAAINPGNSGGALVGMDGRLVGINSAIYSKDGGSLGIGFAIPAAMVKTVIEAHGGKVVRPWIGIEGQAVTPDIAASLGMARPSGVLVNAIHEKSPVHAVGLRIGDVITAVSGHEVTDAEALRYRIATLPVGATAILSVQRGGKTLSLSVPVAAPPEVPARDTQVLTGKNPFAGATVMNVSPAVVEELRLSSEASGVVVADVTAGSTAARVGLQVGDILLTLNRLPLRSVAALQTALEEPADTWAIQVRRGDQVLTTVLQ